MRKDYVYTKHLCNGGPTAVLHRGYTDEVDGRPVFLYCDGERYKTWYCVDRRSGMAITQGSKRNDVLARARGMTELLNTRCSGKQYEDEVRLFCNLPMITEDQMKR